jgi:hypothetical protein
MRPVVVLSAAYFVAFLAFVAAYVVLRFRFTWSQRTIAAIIVLAALTEVAAFLFLMLAGVRGWIV